MSSTVPQRPTPGVLEQQQAAAPSEAATADAEWALGAAPTTPLPIWWLGFQQLVTGFNPMLSLIGDYIYGPGADGAAGRRRGGAISSASALLYWCPQVLRACIARRIATPS